MKNTKRYLVLAAVALLLLITWYFLKSSKSEPIVEQYRTELVKRGDVKQIVSANGTLNPVTLVNVGTQISGKVEKIYADFNDRVKSNQILLELDPTLLVAQLNQSKAQLIKAEASLALAEANKKRGEKLHLKNYLSDQDYEQLVQLLLAAKADLKLAQAQVNRDQINLDYATIQSPVSGVVVDREVDVGQTVAASFQTPTLFKIAQDLRKMQIDSSFAEADIGNIKPKQEVTFTVDAFPNSNFKGVVKQIRLNPTTVQNVVTYDVVVLVDNPDETLLPGMTAYVNIKTVEKKAVLLVPNAALRFKPANVKLNKTDADLAPGMSLVYKLSANKIVPVTCKVGISDNRNTEVTCDKLLVQDKVLIGENSVTSQTTSRSFRMRSF